MQFYSFAIQHFGFNEFCGRHSRNAKICGTNIQEDPQTNKNLTAHFFCCNKNFLTWKAFYLFLHFSPLRGNNLGMIKGRRIKRAICSNRKSIAESSIKLNNTNAFLMFNSIERSVLRTVPGKREESAKITENN